MTPTYLKLKTSYIDGVSVTKLRLFNSREDVEYFQLFVFNNEWEPVPFATTDRVIKVGTNKTKLFEIYIRNTDVDKAMYVCSVSKIYKGTKQIALVSSKICSKLKKEE